MTPPGFETLCLTFTAPIVHCKEEAMWESWFNECSTETLQSSETQYKSKRTHVSLCFTCKINLFKCISKRKESRTKNENWKMKKTNPTSQWETWNSAILLCKSFSQGWKRDRIRLVVFVEAPRRHLVCKARSYNARFWGLNWIKQTERRGCIVTVQNVFLHDW